MSITCHTHDSPKQTQVTPCTYDEKSQENLANPTQNKTHGLCPPVCPHNSGGKHMRKHQINQLHNGFHCMESTQ